MKNFSITDNILRFDGWHRGGGIEISCDDLGKKYLWVKMTAYQNYLWGGMLWSIQGSCNAPLDAKLSELLEELKRFYFEEVDGTTWFELYEWHGTTWFEANQKMPASGY